MDQEVEIARMKMLEYKADPKTAKTEECKMWTVRYLQLSILHKSWV